jgi:hypothetical protein
LPRLVFSSEKTGCGATIELDNGDTCLISVAQAGVLVRSYRKGFFNGILGSFLGPVLYSEKSGYVAAKTAKSLDARFPEPIQVLNFRNPVLMAFANAVWHCSSAAQVAGVLNEAIVNPPS